MNNPEETFTESEATVSPKKMGNRGIKWGIFSMAIFVFAICTILIIRLLLSPSNIYEADVKLIPAQRDGKWGYINKKGAFVIQPQFSGADYFSEGLARVTDVAGSVGFINKHGKYIIPSQYKSATIFSDGLAFVVKDCESPVCINKKGKIIFKLPQAELVGCFIDGLAPMVTKDGKGEFRLGYVNKRGKIVIEPQFTTGYYFCEGLAPVMNNGGKWGFIDKKGRWSIPPQFNEVHFFNEGLAPVKIGQKYGYIDKTGKMVIQPQFDKAYIFSNGLAQVENGGKWGFINSKGQFVISQQFANAEGFLFSDFSNVISNGKHGFIDKKGKYSIVPQFDGAFPMVDGIAMVSQNGKWGIINKKGEMIVTPQFDNMLVPIRNLGLIRSDYYDCSKFLGEFLKDFDRQHVDGLQAKATLGDLTNFQYPVTITQYSAYAYPNQQLTPDISLQSVEFEFDDETYGFSDTDWSFDRKYDNSLPIASVQYGFKVSERETSIAASLAKKISAIYGGKIQKHHQNRSIYIVSIPSENFNFIIVGFYGSIQMAAYFDKEIFEEELRSLKEEIAAGELDGSYDSVDEIKDENSEKMEDDEEWDI